MAENQKYTVSIKVALPGTPLMENGKQAVDNKTGKEKTSEAGHMWYSISDGNNSVSYGFSSDNGKAFGPGTAYIGDDDKYHKPYYMRTMEITKEQYEQLNTYGKTAVGKINPDFNLKYNGLSNSCIDFTWKALNSAGLHHKPELDMENTESIPTSGDPKKFEGGLKPAYNIGNIRSIPAPFPDSELNKEERNKEPSGRTFIQWFLSQNEELSVDQAVNLINNNNIEYEDLMAIGKRLDKDKLEEYLNSDTLLKDIESKQSEKGKEKEEDKDDNINYHRA